MDWAAYDDDTYDGAPDSNCPVGWGATKEAAVANLLEQIEERSMTNNDVPPVISGDALTAEVGFTPGPWRLDDPSNSHVLGGNYHVIEAGAAAYAPNDGVRGFRLAAFMSLADAKLIHAAPDMAEALREVADFWAGGDAPQELTDRINAALSKAGL